MGLRELDSIDIILKRPPFETEPCQLILVIVDATSDLSDEERLRLLTLKLAGYFSYVAAPDFPRKHSNMTPADVIVRVLTVMPPTIEMQMVNALKSADGKTRLRVVFDDYHAYMAKIRSNRNSPPSSN